MKLDHLPYESVIRAHLGGFEESLPWASCAHCRCRYLPTLTIHYGELCFSCGPHGEWARSRELEIAARPEPWQFVGASDVIEALRARGILLAIYRGRLRFGGPGIDQAVTGGRDPDGLAELTAELRRLRVGEFYAEILRELEDREDASHRGGRPPARHRPDAGGLV